HSSGNKTLHPLESFSTRKPQAPLCQICHKESSTPNTSGTMHHNVVPSLCIGNRLLNCLFQVILGRHPKIRNGQIQHLESRFEVQRSQIVPGLVKTFFVTRQEDNDRNLFLTKLVINLAMEVIGSIWHWTTKDTTEETKGQVGQRH